MNRQKMYVAKRFKTVGPIFMKICMVIQDDSKKALGRSVVKLFRNQRH